MDDYQAYRHTTFEADTPVGRVAVRVGDSSDKIQRLLEFCDADSWSIMTAWNPGGTFAGEDENRRRQEALETELAEKDVTLFPGESVPDSPDWAPAQCVLIVDVAPQRALQLAREYGQDSILFGARGEPARLLDTETGEDVTRYGASPEPDDDADAELQDVLGDLGGTLDESVDRYRSEPPSSLRDAVDWELVLRSMNEDDDND